jgi:hypothetical protein
MQVNGDVIHVYVFELFVGKMANVIHVYVIYVYVYNIAISHIFRVFMCIPISFTTRTFNAGVRKMADFTAIVTIKYEMHTRNLHNIHNIHIRCALTHRQSRSPSRNHAHPHGITLTLTVSRSRNHDHDHAHGIALTITLTQSRSRSRNRSCAGGREVAIVTMTCETPGASIRYALDKPSATGLPASGTASHVLAGHGM